MIPILYSGEETSFTSNGLGRLSDCLKCEVTEERNGIYECQFQYPITGAHYSDIQEGRIIAVIHDDKKDIQPFDIYKRSAPMNGIVTFNARHISYRLSNVILRPFEATSCIEAFAKFPTNVYSNCPFTFWTDKATTGNFTVKKPSSLRSMLGGVQGSILDTYGTGDYEWDKWTVRLHAHRGTDTGVEIRYGLNLTDIKQGKDVGSTYTAVIPFWYGSDTDTLVVSPTAIMTSDVPYRTYDLTEHNDVVITDHNGNALEVVRAELKYSTMDLSEDFEEAPTIEQLRARAVTKFTNNTPWKANENIDIDFIALWQTEEYKNVAALQRVSLCDRVNVYYKRMGVDAVSARVIRVVYDVLLERYKSMELGDPQTTMHDVVSATVSDSLGTAMVNTVTKSGLKSAIENATKLINGGLGGHVVINTNAAGQPQELLIMDTDDVNTAVNVWRFNLGGLGHSHSGYNGPFNDVALTMDGSINANMITAGIINAALIRTGVLADVNNRNYWNLATGEFSLSSNTTVGGSTGKKIAQDAVDDLDEDLNQQSIFNRLTNNGQTQGIYLKSGRVYINATYMDTGTLSATLIKSGLLGSDLAPKNYWNLATGEFSLVSSASEKGITYKNGQLVINANAITSGILSDSTGNNSWDLDNGYFTVTGDFITKNSAGTKYVRINEGNITLTNRTAGVMGQLNVADGFNGMEILSDEGISIVSGSNGIGMGKLSTDASKRMIISGPVVFSGKVEFGNDVAIIKNITVTKDLTVSGATTLEGYIYGASAGGLQFYSPATFNSAATFKGGVNVIKSGTTYAGANGTFTAGNKAVTVRDGIITSIVSN